MKHETQLDPHATAPVISEDLKVGFCLGLFVGCFATVIMYHVISWALEWADRRESHVDPNNALVNSDLSGARNPPWRR